jgi:malic enzyme
VLDSKAKKIDDYTAIAAAEELAKFAQEKGLRKDYIVPNMEEREIYPRIAATVAEDAVKRGLSDMKESREYFYKKAKKIIGLK